MSDVKTLLTAMLNGDSIDEFVPRSRIEAYLKNCCLACGCDGLPEPVSEIDTLLFLLSEKLAGGGGGGSTGEEWFNDGDTHIWITLPEGRTSPMLGVCPKGTVTVDWGDGTEPDVLTGTSTSTVKWTPTHNYAKPGDYIITLKVDGKMGLDGKSDDTSYAYILRYTSAADGKNMLYQDSITKVEIGNGVTWIGNSAFHNLRKLKAIAINNSVEYIGSYVFGKCSSLTSVTLPDGYTYISNYAFNNCYLLTSVVIPDGFASIGRYAFGNCESLATIDIPASVTDISNDAFRYCYGVRCYDFSKHTTVPTLSNTSAFTGIADDCEIRVPAALYDEWIAATNWSTYASQIVTR